MLPHQEWRRRQQGVSLGALSELRRPCPADSGGARSAFRTCLVGADCPGGTGQQADASLVASRFRAL